MHMGVHVLVLVMNFLMEGKVVMLLCERATQDLVTSFLNKGKWDYEFVYGTNRFLKESIQLVV